jgi:hypothetical protein
MDDDSRVIDRGWDALPEYGNQPGDADEAVTVSISTTPGEWLVNTVDAVVVPMSMAELVDGLRNHKLTERSLVWRAGMPEWATVDRVPQLKLAARMAPAPRASVDPPHPVAAAPATRSKPPPKPVRSTPPATAHASPVSPQHIPSRRSTLPFGLSTPLASQSRPANARPSSPRAAVPPPASKEEPEVLAVYERPAATISFDLSPVQPLRAPAPVVPPAPQTLAPLTTDSGQRRAPIPRSADLSVVAASDFRQVQRSSKRLVWVSSLASAAAASLLTFLAARSGAPPATPSSSPGRPLAAAAPAVTAPPPAPVAPSEPTPAPASSATTAAASTSVASAKPKAVARKARAVSAVRAPRPDVEARSATKDPSTEPNPYDVKLDEEPPAAKAAPAATRGATPSADSQASEASASSATSPGF